MRILIADDEPANITILRTVLEGQPGIQVAGTAGNGPEALASIRLLRPDLVFLDIQMPGLDGFGVLEELAPGERPLVVFVTAYDQYALRAFQVHAVDYLLKPAEDGAVLAALERARQLLPSAERQALMERLDLLLERVETDRPRLERFVVREGERMLFLRTEDVEAIEATGNYMHLYIGRASHMIRQTMERLEAGLDPARFVRTHKSWLVNVEKIREIATGINGLNTIHLAGGVKVPVSRRFRPAIDRLVKGR